MATRGRGAFCSGSRARRSPRPPTPSPQPTSASAGWCTSQRPAAPKSAGKAEQHTGASPSSNRERDGAVEGLGAHRDAPLAGPAGAVSRAGARVGPSCCIRALPATERSWFRRARASTSSSFNSFPVAAARAGRLLPPAANRPRLSILSQLQPLSNSISSGTSIASLSILSQLQPQRPSSAA